MQHTLRARTARPWGAARNASLCQRCERAAQAARPNRCVPISAGRLHVGTLGVPQRTGDRWPGQCNLSPVACATFGAFPPRPKAVHVTRDNASRKGGAGGVVSVSRNPLREAGHRVAISADAPAAMKTDVCGVGLTGWLRLMRVVPRLMGDHLLEAPGFDRSAERPPGSGNRRPSVRMCSLGCQDSRAASRLAPAWPADRVRVAATGADGSTTVTLALADAAGS